MTDTNQTRAVAVKHIDAITGTCVGCDLLTGTNVVFVRDHKHPQHSLIKDKMRHGVEPVIEVNADEFKHAPKLWVASVTSTR